MEFDAVSGMLEHAEFSLNDFQSQEADTNHIQFYHLEKEPFRDSIDPYFFYRVKSHEEAYMRMMFTIEHDVSLGMVNSTSGMGKTLLSQMILTNLDENKYFPRLILVTPKMTRSGLVTEIASELGLLEEGAGYNIKKMLIEIQNFAIDLYRKNRKLVLLIDEAHFLSSDALHIIRTLSNIEIPEKKLVTCLLFSENSLWRRMQRDTYKSIRSRLYQRYELKPLTERETVQYIKYRILMSGGDENLFTQEACLLIYKKSAGVCREINKLCTLALFDGFITRKKQIDLEVLDDSNEALALL